MRLVRRLHIGQSRIGNFRERVYIHKGLEQVRVTSSSAQMIVNVRVLERPPPGADVVTATCDIPFAARSAAGITAMSCEALKKEVASGTLSNSTTELVAKPEPFTRICKSSPPAEVDEGESDEMLGLALSGPPIGKLTAGDAINSPGAFTAILANPLSATSVALIWALTCVELMKVVGRTLPFHVTTSFTVKLFPFTVSVNALSPALALTGENELIVRPPGCAATIVKSSPFCDGPPPGGGFTSVMLPIPAATTSEARICTASWLVVRLKVVERGAPFQ